MEVKVVARSVGFKAARRGVSTLVAVLVLIAIVLVGGLIFYSNIMGFFSRMFKSVRVEAYATGAVASNGAAVSLTVINRGTLPIIEVQAEVAGRNFTFKSVTPSTPLEPGRSAAETLFITSEDAGEEVESEFTLISANEIPRVDGAVAVSGGRLYYVRGGTLYEADLTGRVLRTLQLVQLSTASAVGFHFSGSNLYVAVPYSLYPNGPVEGTAVFQVDLNSFSVTRSVYLVAVMTRPNFLYVRGDVIYLMSYHTAPYIYKYDFSGRWLYQTWIGVWVIEAHAASDHIILITYLNSGAMVLDLNLQVVASISFAAQQRPWFVGHSPRAVIIAGDRIYAVWQFWFNNVFCLYYEAFSLPYLQVVEAFGPVPAQQAIIGPAVLDGQYLITFKWGYEGFVAMNLAMNKCLEEPLPEEGGQPLFLTKVSASRYVTLLQYNGKSVIAVLGFSTRITSPQLPLVRGNTYTVKILVKAADGSEASYTTTFTPT